MRTELKKSDEQLVFFIEQSGITPLFDARIAILIIFKRYFL